MDYLTLSNPFVAAACANTLQLTVGYPLDTIKVWIQTRQKISLSNVKGLYSGIQYPLLTQSSMAGLYFSLFEYTKNIIPDYCAATVTGATFATIATPIEYMKIRSQVQIKQTKLPPTGHIIKSLPYVLLREVPFSCIFLTLQNRMSQAGYEPHVSGALSSMAAWTLTYPMDQIKTLQLSAEVPGSRKITPKDIKFDPGLPISLFRVGICGSIFMSTYKYMLRYDK